MPFDKSVNLPQVIESRPSRPESHVWSDFQSLIENVLDIITVLDVKGTIIYESPSVERVLGFTPSQLVGRSAFAFIHPLDIPKVMPVFMLGLVTPGVPHSVKFRFKHVNGSWCHLEAVGKSIVEQDGTHRIIVTSRPVSADSETKFSLGETTIRFGDLVEGLGEGLLITDGADRILYANIRLSELMGYEQEEMIGRTPYELFLSEEHWSVYQDFKEKWLKGESEHCEIPLLRKDRTPLWFFINVTAYRSASDQPLGIQAALTDITAKKKAEAELQEAYAALEERVIERTAELQSVNGKLLIENEIRQRSENALRESQERFHSLAESMPQIVWVAGPSGAIEYANERMKDYSGSREISEDTWNRIIHPEDATLYFHRWNAALGSGADFETEFRMLCAADQTYRWHICRALAMRDEAGAIIRWFGTSTDIHEKKLAEEALRENRDALDQRVRERTSQLRETNENLEREILERKAVEVALITSRNHAEEMNRLKSAFLANMSHEIRTPMTSILGFAGLLSESLQGSELEEFSGMIETSGKRLMDTINSILDMAKIEANRVELNPTEVIVEDEIRKVVDMLRPLAVQKGIGLRLDIHKRDISGEIDAHYFGRILTNIIGNAVKFTKEGFVAVELDRMQSLESDAVADGIRVRVRDSGVGISEDFLPHIFDEFKQESSGWSRDFEGTGLGLTLSKHLVELMSGNITVESKRGEGSTFTIELPLKNLHIPFENIRANDSEWATKIRSERTSASTCVDHQIHVTNSVSAAKRRLSRVLLVEDNYESARLTTILLSEVCSVDHASDIASAGALLEANRYELILMDVNLKSGQSGLDLTKALRQIARHQTIPIIALTAYAMKGDRESALSAGCDDYLSKPFTKDQLVDAVTAQLSKTLASIPSANY